MKVLIVSKSAVVASHHGRFEEIAKLGVDLTVIVPPRYGSQPLEIRHANLYRIRVLPCWFTPYNHFHFYPARIGPIDADLVHLEEEPWSLVTHQFMRLCVKARKPVIFFTWQNLYKSYPPPFSAFERFTFRHANAAIAGNSEAQSILRARGFHKIAPVVGCGVDPAVFVRREVAPLRARLGLENAFVIGFMGRIVPSKGIADLIRAFALLPLTCTLLIVGDGDYRAEAQRLATSLGVESRIRWIPQVHSMEVPDYMSLFDVLVLPSRTMRNWKEQFGRVLIEAISCEVPPVGSSSGEIPNVIGDAGVIFPEGDVAALAQRLRLLHDRPDVLADLRGKGRARVLKHFTQRKVAEDIVNVYKEVLGQVPAEDERETAVPQRIAG